MHIDNGRFTLVNALLQEIPAERDRPLTPEDHESATRHPVPHGRCGSIGSTQPCFSPSPMADSAARNMQRSWNAGNKAKAGAHALGAAGGFVAIYSGIPTLVGGLNYLRYKRTGVWYKSRSEGAVRENVVSTPLKLLNAELLGIQNTADEYLKRELCTRADLRRVAKDSKRCAQQTQEWLALQSDARLRGSVIIHDLARSIDAAAACLLGVTKGQAQAEASASQSAKRRAGDSDLDPGSVGGTQT